MTARTLTLPQLWSAIAVLALPPASAAAAETAPATLPPAPASASAALRVCADPDNLPFSNDQEQGLENRIAQILGADLNLPVEYTWQSQRRGFLRRSLNAGRCDVVVGAPAGLGGLILTKPYYRSAYVLVTRRATDKPAPATLDDPKVRNLRIGLYAIGMEGANTPAAMALAARGITANVQGFPLVGGDEHGPAAAGLIDAVAKGDIDLAFAWGPFAGYFARPYGAKLSITPVTADPCVPDMAFAYDMAVGVRSADTALRDRLQAALDRRRGEIDAVLADYGVPRLPVSAPDQAPSLTKTAAAAGQTAPNQGDATCAYRPS